MTKDSPALIDAEALIKEIEKTLPSASSPELSERAYRQAGEDIIAIIRRRIVPAEHQTEQRAINRALRELTDSLAMADRYGTGIKRVPIGPISQMKVHPMMREMVIDNEADMQAILDACEKGAHSRVAAISSAGLTEGRVRVTTLKHEAFITPVPSDEKEQWMRCFRSVQKMVKSNEKQGEL